MGWLLASSPRERRVLARPRAFRVEAGARGQVSAAQRLAPGTRLGLRRGFGSFPEVEGRPKALKRVTRLPSGGLFLLLFGKGSPLKATNHKRCIFFLPWPPGI